MSRLSLLKAFGRAVRNCLWKPIEIYGVTESASRLDQVLQEISDCKVKKDVKDQARKVIREICTEDICARGCHAETDSGGKIKLVWDGGSSDFVSLSIVPTKDNTLQLMFLDSGFDPIAEIYPNTPHNTACLLYTSPSPRDQRGTRMPSSA